MKFRRVPQNRQPKGIRAMILALTLALTAPVAEASKPPRYSPDWARSLESFTPNQSFLDRWDTPDDSADLDILDARSTAMMQQQYEDLSRNLSMKSQYGLASREDGLDYHGRAEAFSRQLFRMILSYQMSNRLKRAEKNSSEVRTVTTVQQATEKLTVQVDEGIRFGTRTDIPNQKGRLWLSSPYFDGAVDVDFRAHWDDPSEFDPKRVDPSQRRDRYTVSLSRGLPVLNVKSGVSYGVESTLMTASVSKSLMKGLSCELLTRRGLDVAKSGLGGSEEAVKLFYKVNF